MCGSPDPKGARDYSKLSTYHSLSLKYPFQEIDNRHSDYIPTQQISTLGKHKNCLVLQRGESGIAILSVASVAYRLPFTDKGNTGILVNGDSLETLQALFYPCRTSSFLVSICLIKIDLRYFLDETFM